mmetsp:Transcript_51530/g.76874  ORF Transcript_51530/g.76874 Transcript_51530/m.76874 type:complete len:88 (-) Transcript_51530:45-308(-)
MQRLDELSHMHFSAVSFFLAFFHNSAKTFFTSILSVVYSTLPRRHQSSHHVPLQRWYETRIAMFEFSLSCSMRKSQDDTNLLEDRVV